MTSSFSNLFTGMSSFCTKVPIDWKRRLTKMLVSMAHAKPSSPFLKYSTTIEMYVSMSTMERPAANERRSCASCNEGSYQWKVAR